MRARHGVRILAYIARADGHLPASEADIIERYVADVAEGAAFDRRLARRFIANLSPDRDAVVEAVRNIARCPETRPALASAIGYLILEAIDRSTEDELLRIDDFINRLAHLVANFNVLGGQIHDGDFVGICARHWF